MKPNPVVWFEIYVQDLTRAQRFYETVFQCALQTLATPAGLEGGMQMLSFPGDMSTMGSGGMLVRMDGVPSGGGGTLVYFACDDCAVEQGRVVAALAAAAAAAQRGAGPRQRWRVSPVMSVLNTSPSSAYIDAPAAGCP